MASSRLRGRDRARGGRRKWATLGAVVLALLGLTFALGVLAGRHWGDRHVPTLAAAEDARKSGTGVRRGGGLSEPTVERPRPHPEKLTFYQTLTAPLGEAPLGGKLEIGARPEPVATSNVSKPLPRSVAVSEHAPRVDETAAASSGARPETGTLEGRPVEDRRDSSAAWAVQVGVFRNAQQAERMRKALADGGFPVRLAPVTGDDGQPRYRVRVGAFKTREEALKLAERLRADRALPTYVTNN